MALGPEGSFLTYSTQAVVLSGSQWAYVLSLGYNTLASKLQADIASALQLPTDQIGIISMTDGPLTVEFTAVRNGSQALPDSVIDSILLSAHFSETQSYYDAVTGAAEQIHAISASIIQASITVDPVNQVTSVCSSQSCRIGLIAGGSAGAIAALVLLYCCCCRRGGARCGGRSTQGAAEDQRPPGDAVRAPHHRHPADVLPSKRVDFVESGQWDGDDGSGFSDIFVVPTLYSPRRSESSGRRSWRRDFRSSSTRRQARASQPPTERAQSLFQDPRRRLHHRGTSTGDLLFRTGSRLQRLDTVVKPLGFDGGESLDFRSGEALNAAAGAEVEDLFDVDFFYDGADAAEVSLSSGESDRAGRGSPTDRWGDVDRRGPHDHLLPSESPPLESIEAFALDMGAVDGQRGRNVSPSPEQRVPGSSSPPRGSMRLDADGRAFWSPLGPKWIHAATDLERL
jgi:hypothetical protein